MFERDHEPKKADDVDKDSNDTRKAFADSMDQSSSGKRQGAPADGERAYHQTDDGAVSMKCGIGGERQIRAQAVRLFAGASISPGGGDSEEK